MTARRKVLLLAYHFPPLGGAGSLRLLSFAEYLPQFGWDPVVVTVGAMEIAGQDASVLGRLRDGPAVHRWFTPIAGSWALRRNKAIQAPGRPQEGPANSRREGVLPGRQIDGEAATPPRRRRLLRSAARSAAESLLAVPDHAVLWSLAAGIRAGHLMRHHGIEVFMTSSPPHSELAGGLLAKRISRAAWVVDLRDPWRSGDRLNARSFRNAAGGWLEDKAVRTAERVLANTPRFLESLRAGPGVDPRRIEVLPNGYDADEIAEAVRAVQAHPRAADSPFTVVHAGTLYRGFREPYTVLEAIARAQELVGPEARQIRLVLAGDSSFHHRPELRRRIEDLGLAGRVEMPGYLPHKEALLLAASSDLLLVMQGGESVSLNVPFKAYEYLAMGRPVLCLAGEGATADLVRRSPMGEVIAPTDVGSIATSIVRHVEGRLARPETSLPMPPPGVFSRRELTARLAAILDSAVSVRRS